MASLASAWLSYKSFAPRKNIILYTFGMPRVGNYDYALQHDQLVNNSWRVVNDNDLVPHFPTLASVTILNGPYHHDFLQGKPLQSCLTTLKKHNSYQGIELLYVSFGKMDLSRKSSFSYGKSCPNSKRKRFCHEEDDIESMMKTEVAQIGRDGLPIELSNDNSVRLFCHLWSLYTNRA